MRFSLPALRPLALAVVALAPLVLLFDLRAWFYADWDINLWLVGYYGEYFKGHGHMPGAVNIASAVGISAPVFYGYLLYPALGLVSAGLGAAWALRVGIVLLVAFQCYALLCAGRIAFRNRGLGRGGGGRCRMVRLLADKSIQSFGNRGIFRKRVPVFHPRLFDCGGRGVAVGRSKAPCLAGGSLGRGDDWQSSAHGFAGGPGFDRIRCHSRDGLDSKRRARETAHDHFLPDAANAGRGNAGSLVLRQFSAGVKT